MTEPRGVWLLPTRGRVANLRRFLSAAREMGTVTQGWCLVDEDDYQTNELAYAQAMALAPPGWTIRTGPNPDRRYGGALRAVWPAVKDMDWIGLVCDDLVPATGNWDVGLIKHLQGWNVVSSNDGWQAVTGDINRDRMHGAIAWSGPLARAVGWIFPDGLNHIFHDDAWEAMGRETACWQVHTEVMVKHLHEAKDGVIGPTMDPQSALWKHDEAWFKNWIATDKPACVERIKKHLESFGVRQMKPDLSGVSIMIGTPCIDARYESTFMISLFQTIRFLDSCGVASQFAEEKYTADIALARSNIFSAFVRSNCTHLLTIDADMSWGVDAIIRLFNAKKDFAAVAGPKKRYPITFAASYTSENGDPIQLQYDPESGAMEIGEIGSAFLLITRNCATKMVESYPELHYTGVTGESNYGVYTPMVISKKWYSEDFAFCKRWRGIGGHCYMIPEVVLGHTGAHTFSGSFAEMAQRQQAEQAQRIAAE